MGSSSQLTLKDRLLAVIGDEEPYRWAARHGISKATLFHILNKGGNPRAEQLLRIGAATGKSIEWLLTGEEPMWREEEGNGQVEAPPIEYRQAPELLDAEEFVLVPRYDVRASTGPGALVHSEQVVDHLAFRRQWVRSMGLQAEQLALITAKGDSMEPTIRQGFLLLVDLRQHQVKDDAIYVLRIDSTLVAKRLQKMFTGEIKVKSDNPAYDEQLVPEDQIDKLNVIGRVVWGGGRM
jgi:phage repressor protein C with HTH and peptisase S24 domain